MLSDRSMDFGEALCTALLGLDAVYAAEKGKTGPAGESDIDRLVVLNMSDRHQPDPFTGYEDAIARFRDLAVQAGELPEPDRRLYYRQTCESAVAFAEWRSTGLPFADQIARFLHVPAEPPRAAELDRLRGEMRRMLSDLGYSGDLAQQADAWQDRQRVSSDEVEGVMDTLMREAWDRTIEKIAIPTAFEDGMKVRAVHDTPYNAMCDFPRRTIHLNVDPILTLPSLRHLAVHEAYPGHYVQFIRRQDGYRRGVAAADGLLSVVNTAHSTPFEGIADIGLSIIGWDQTPDDRLAAAMGRYRTGLATRAAWRVHADGWDAAAVRDEIWRDALGGGEGWVDARMRFISAHDRSALMWSYWHGEPNLAPIWQRVAADPARHHLYDAWIYDRLHSVQSLAMFDA